MGSGSLIVGTVYCHCMKTKFNIALVDDDPIFRKSFEYDLHKRNLVSKVHRFVGGLGFLEFITAEPHQIDVAFIDVYMPLMNGLETIRKALEIAPDIRYIGMSAAYYDETARMLEQIGAFSYCPKRMDYLYQAVMHATVLEGTMSTGGFFHPGSEHNPKIEKLYPDQVALLCYVAQGKTSREIGELMNMSHRTVEGKRSRLIKQLGLRNEVELAVWAVKNGIV